MNWVVLLFLMYVRIIIWIVNLLVQSGADLNLRGINNYLTPFHYAVKNGHQSIVEFLVKSQSFISKKNYYGLTPLHMVMQYNYVYNEGIPLLHATQNGDLSIVKYFVELGEDVNKENNDGSTPLHIASQYGYQSIVDLSISAPDLIRNSTID